MSFPHEQSQKSGVMSVDSAPYPDGASSAREASLLHRQQQNEGQNSMNKSGGKKRNYRGGTLTVPSFSSTGPQVSAGGQDPTSLSQGANTSGSQSLANSQCDGCYDPTSSPICSTPQCNPQLGGSSCGASGLISDGQSWGCMSGGKRRRTQNRRSRRKKGGMEAVRSVANWLIAPGQQMYDDITGKTDRKIQEDYFKRQYDKLDAQADEYARQTEERDKQEYIERTKNSGNKLDLEGYEEERKESKRMSDENNGIISNKEISIRGGGKRTYRNSRKGKKSKKVKKVKKVKKGKKSKKSKKSRKSRK